MTTESITAFEITSQRRRAATLPRLFGEYADATEATIYSVLGEWCSDFRGAYWKFFALSNGGFFMSPEAYSPLHLSSPDSLCSEPLDSVSTGIAVCLMAFRRLQLQSQDSLFDDAFDRLAAFASRRNDWPQITRLIN